MLCQAKINEMTEAERFLFNFKADKPGCLNFNLLIFHIRTQVSQAILFSSVVNIPRHKEGIGSDIDVLLTVSKTKQSKANT